jgi:hypothetical protein
MAGGLVYIVMYYLPEKIFLSWIQIFCPMVELGGCGGGESVDWPGVRPQRSRTVQENSGHKGINTLGSMESECDTLNHLTKINAIKNWKYMFLKSSE